ncbi:hypothetical protein GCM10010149_45070 [Nonomuraea roseoviolacea subsp. roseoviolacea]|uniref:DNA-binding SARP family transcriptional activator n=1 Tax=Nonomuraea roseoviolacea subsp. carminata TaxID=160689 RepID=A0ABT1K077_9ACTN|nr:AfsR/SARP family transcriptional regulator [Nonomuraea roseoviolacea]MCP2347067.1 DNA-binding SARP family transcriptional activator [Nonomuraea roseoviolacea subsp. carminata]
MQFQVLGVVKTCKDDVAIPLPPKPRHLLAILLSRKGRPVSADHLIDLLWGDRPPRTARKNLQVQVCCLRRLLDDPGRITLSGSGYEASLDSEELDAHVFERLVDSGRASLAEGHVPEGIRTLREALALWSGVAYDGLTTAEGVFHERSRLTEIKLAAMEDLYDAEIARGCHREVLPEIFEVSLEHPYREGLLAQLLLATYRDGRPNEAIALYHQRRELFVRELGTEPGRRLRALYEAMLNEDVLL